MNFQQGIKQINRIRHRAILGYGLACVGITVCGLLVIFLQSMKFLLLGFALLILGLYIARGTINEYKAIYKELIIKKPLAENFDNLNYDWLKGFSVKTVENFQICKMGIGFYSEDLVQASYLGIPFEMSEIEITYNSSGSDDHEEHFHGRMLVFDLPNKNLNSVQVFSKKFKYKADLTDVIDVSTIEMESVEFNQKFLVRALNPQDAFYLLTPQLMERIMSYNQKFKNIALHACGNKIVFALEDFSDDSFDADSPFKKIYYQEEIAKINKEIDDIKAIISIIYNSNPQSAENNEAKSLQPGGFMIEYTDSKFKFVDNSAL